MLSTLEAYDLIREGRPLPQEKHLPIPDDTASILLEAAVTLVTDLGPQPDDVRGSLAADRITNLAEQYGWFAVASLMGMSFAHAYRPRHVDEAAHLFRGNLGELLKTFAVTAAHEETEEGVWSIPLTQLASLEAAEALMFTGFGAALALMGVAEAEMGKR